MHSRLRRGALPLMVFAVAALAALGGCEDDTKPVITKFFATPECDVMTVQTRVNLDPVTGEVTSIDTLGTWLEVRFFARASSGNRLEDPTGANSPLDWIWNFGDGASATNLVNPSHRYTSAGIYDVTLTVKDDDGDEDSRTITVLVGEQYGDLDVLTVDVVPEPQMRFATVPGSVSIARESFGRQFAPDGWNMDFRGELYTDCTVSGLFEQYDWHWELTNLDNPSEVTVIEDRNPARLSLGMTYGHYSAFLETTETVTGIARPDSADSRNPVGLRVGFTIPAQTVPNTSDTIALEAYLLDGVKEFSFELEYADSALAFDRLDFDPGLAAGGFTPSVTDLGGGHLAVSLTHSSTFSTTEAITAIGDLVFDTRDVIEGYYPVRVRNPRALRPETGDPEALAAVTTVDGGVNLGSDCDADGVPDAFAAENFPGLYDCDRNGEIDTCEIAEAQANLAATDGDGNGNPDIDNDGDGILDACQQQ